ncbi:cytadherence high molecular weight protein 2-like isoform X2 [Schistocerca gregaria]|uniref:cytadherence high molecular weight protein 2-like isoform X2 n=1 Tax=Schistocerca gregaria TaxID=7010 RepID=UPI00211F16A3|nr:cytadherence high molecular weight protein 2-like isoform X2 [Schistocerca gregaria]XP_049842840.1 cytadherence high molecular weight protein 2-like isoform X2 [Schistocerca gregaria]
MDGSNHSIFVHGLTEIEVNLMRELLEVFCKDRKRKWLSYTVKNTKDVDSTTFTVLLVQPCTAGEVVRVQEYRRTVCVDDAPNSEKSIDDTAQSCKKLDKVRNESVAVKPHFEITEQKQIGRIIKVVPYCQSRSVQLLENYFDEDSKTADAPDARQQEHFDEESLAYKDARYYTKNNHAEEEPHIDTASGLVYSLGPPFPLLMLNSQQPENSHKHLIRFLEHRMKRSSQLVSNLYENQNQFRMRLIETQKENDLFRQQLHTYQEELNEERKRVNSLEPKLSLLKSHIRAFQKDVDEKELVLHILGRKLHEKNLALKKLELEKNLIKQRYSSLLVSETEEIAQKMQKQLKIQSELKRHLEVKDEKLRQIRQILNIAPAGSHMGTSKLKRSHSLRDVALGDAALGVDSGSQIEILRQSVEMGN